MTGRDALSTLADYTLGTVIVMVQLAMADRRSVRIAHDLRTATKPDDAVARTAPS
jgi:hypothetical protein